MNNPYQMSDKAAKLLQKKAIKRVEQAKRDCSIAGFDELNVIKTIKKLYADLAKDNEENFLRLAGMAYEDAIVHGSSKPSKKWLNKVLDEYDPVALYIYLNEIDRKRDYATEAIIAAKDKAKEFRRALNYWTRMTAHIADRVTDEATIKAYKDAGVQKVRWETEEDDRVCDHCEPRDGKVYPINEVPTKPHWGCRCWLTPVI